MFLQRFSITAVLRSLRRTREDDEAHAALLRWAKKGMSAERAEIAARKKALSVDERHAERVARNLAARGA